MSSFKKGVTLIALVIIIIVIGILFGIVSASLDDLITETRVKEFASELDSLEYLINDYKIRNNGELDFTEYKLSTLDLSEDFLEQLVEEEIVNNTVNLYKIDYVKIDAIDSNYGLQKLGEEDIYLVSGTTGNVYYKKGFEYNGKIYYTLTDDLKNKLEK